MHVYSVKIKVKGKDEEQNSFHENEKVKHSMRKMPVIRRNCYDVSKLECLPNEGSAMMLAEVEMPAMPKKQKKRYTKLLKKYLPNLSLVQFV